MKKLNRWDVGIKANNPSEQANSYEKQETVKLAFNRCWVSEIIRPQSATDCFLPETRGNNEK
jgi:hypothetical protein